MERFWGQHSPRASHPRGPRAARKYDDSTSRRRSRDTSDNSSSFPVKDARPLRRKSAIGCRGCQSDQRSREPETSGRRGPPLIRPPVGSRAPGALWEMFLGVFRACACVRAGRRGHSGVSVAHSVGPLAEDTFSAEAVLGPFRPAGSPRPRRELRVGRVLLDPSASPRPGALRTLPLYPRRLFPQVSSPKPLPLGAPGQGGAAGPETPGVAPTSARAWGPRGVGGRGPGGDGCAG